MIQDNFSSKLQPTPNQIYFSKKDPLDPRMGDLFKPFLLGETTVPENSLLILGYKDDRGVKNNRGREGASLGPDGIRSLFYKLTTNFFEKNVFYDLGNWETNHLPDLEKTHHGIKTEIKQLHLNTNFIISLGGGHDYAYPDSYGFIESQLKLSPSLKPLLINFDAHLDVRSDEKGINSGTAFYKVLKEYHQHIDFYEIGIQPQCNSSFHAHFTKNHSGHIISIEDIKRHSLNYYLNEIFKNHSQQPLFVTLDIDVLNSFESPGCSQSWPGGLSFNELFSGMDILCQFKNWFQLGIYEVAPPLDINFNTQRSAALFMYKYFQYYKEYHYGD